MVGWVGGCLVGPPHSLLTFFLGGVKRGAALGLPASGFSRSSTSPKSCPIFSWTK